MRNTTSQIWIVLLFAVASCKTTAPETQPTEPANIAAQQPAPPAPTVDPALPAQVGDDLADEDELDEDDAILLETEDSADGFCKDDIYAEYLKNKFLREHSYQKFKKEHVSKYVVKKTRGKKFKTISAMTQREMEAMYYARSRMVGEMVPYYGAIPVVSNPMVEYWIRFFKTTGRKQFLRWLVRGESVRELVSPILREQGLPLEFLYLSMVESGFSNTAYSRAKATGPWQFMQGTARLYGLNINLWIDERRDPAKSTLAAAKHLRDLYEDFGDWYLTMAAYNAGAGRIRSAIKKAGSKDFWAIANSPYLPIETKHYVPKVIAALTMAANPRAHGFEFVSNEEDRMPTSLVHVKEPVSIRELGDKLGVEEPKLRQWNPELVNAITPPAKNGGYVLRLSDELVKKFQDIENSLSYVEVKDVLMHKVGRGETLARIAAKYKVSIRQILNINPGLKPARLSIGKVVAVPAPSVVLKPKTGPRTAFAH